MRRASAGICNNFMESNIRRRASYAGKKVRKMGRRILLFLLIGSLCVVNVRAESIKWVDFSVSEAS